MDLGLRGRVAAVGAASKGLGRATAVALAREGADVAICARSDGPLQDAAEELRALGVRVHAEPLDLPTPGACERFVQGTVEALGRLDVMVINCGGPTPGTTDAFADDDYRAALEQNLLTSVRLARASVPHMRANGWGRIVQIMSFGVKQPIEGLALSNTARAGAVGFAKTLATEIAPHGITVNTVAPGPFLTDRNRELAAAAAARAGISVDEALAAAGAGIPARRIGDPAELGALVAFLASEHAGFITGTTIQIDGGAVRSLL